MGRWKRIEILNLPRCIVLQSKVDKVGDGHGMPLIRVAYRIINTQTCIWKSGHLRILTWQFHVHFISEKKVN